MSVRWFHIIGLIALGYALGYWMPQLGKMTLGKLYQPQG